MKTAQSRRQFLQATVLTTAGLAWTGCTPSRSMARRPLFEISLAEWSLHKTILNEKKLTNLDFPVVARREFGIGAVEYVNQMFMDKARDAAYLRELKHRCDGEGVRSLLIMCDREGNLGDADAARRTRAVENHHKWAEAAKFLGCHSIRVNAATGNVGTYDEQKDRAADGLRRLSMFCATLGLNCIVENHGGLSSNGAWLAAVMREVNLPNCGTLPDFGNFRLDDGTMYDRYQGVAEMMPFAKAVSAKANQFDNAGNCVETDYRRMMKIVLDAGYRGWVGIEYEGNTLSEYDGIRATKRLLEIVRGELQANGTRKV
ncbi:MAG TPA: sugar phosphate isomerase/epimerase family protein [Methylomirabilota bacterium]|nr:sugar phosphate isomerase/epimerase family protein [Methylomirabilota bacterium]